MAKMTSAELAKLCEGVPVKRVTLGKSYRYELTGRNGNYVRKLVCTEAKPAYVRGARKSRGAGACGHGVWSWAIPKI